MTDTEPDTRAGLPRGEEQTPFHRVDWRRTRLGTVTPRAATGATGATGATMVVLDRHGLGEQLCAELARRGEPAIRVEPDALTGALAARLVDGTEIRRIVDLGGYEPPDVLAVEQALEERGWPELTRLSDLVRSTRGTGRRRSVYAVTSQAVAVQPRDVPVCAVAPVAGFLKSVDQEVPWLRCRHVDLAFGDTGNVRHLLDELDSTTPDVQVAYRDGARFTPHLVPLPSELPAPTREPRPGELYVMSGGLGGVGVEIAEHLLRGLGVRLLVLGRTPHENRYPAYRRLRAHGELRYVVTDVRDEVRVRAAVHAAEQHWATKLAGVLHLAGIAGDGAAIEQTSADLAAVLAPKARGAWVLHKLVRDRPGALFVSFSSVTGFLGGATDSADAAASAFLDAFAGYQRTRGLASYSLGWSRWDGLGMSRDRPHTDLMKARGIAPLSRRQGVRSFGAALRHDHAHQLIGLHQVPDEHAN